ncbi:Hsp33 family molecular chaperone HslO [Pontiella sp.]|uniref:Hsp33 family molecular chaperone HslO n=1 Tax=Pontiella sp. TaxID=2837462 RepID=UPI0035658C3C
MNDLLYKGHFKGLDIAFTYTVATAAVNESVVRHDCDPAAAHVLGRATAAGLLAAALLPEQRRLNACWKYEGGLKTVVVDAGNDGTVRSLISPNHLQDLEDAHEGLYGEKGQLQVITTENGRIVNSGTTPIPLHDAVNDLAYHFSISDQVETGMSVMIGFEPDPEKPVALCQGWMIQALPNTDLERFERIRYHMGDFGFRDLLGHESAADSYFEQIAKVLVGQEPDYKGVHMEACPPPKFKCTCSREKMYAVLRSIPIPDRMTMVKRKEPVGINCQFCSKHYKMTINECIVAWNQKPAQ